MTRVSMTYLQNKTIKGKESFKKWLKNVNVDTFKLGKASDLVYSGICRSNLAMCAH